MLRRGKHFNQDGQILRSKSELIIELMLKQAGISYEYEKPLGPHIPDFTIIYNGRVFFWEHLGGLDEEKYRNRWERKRKWYIDNGYWDSVITSEEDRGRIDLRTVMDSIHIIKNSTIPLAKVIDKRPVIDNIPPTDLVDNTMKDDINISMSPRHGTPGSFTLRVYLSDPFGSQFVDNYVISNIKTRKDTGEIEILLEKVNSGCRFTKHNGVYAWRQTGSTKLFRQAARILCGSGALKMTPARMGMTEEQHILLLVNPEDIRIGVSNPRRSKVDTSTYQTVQVPSSLEPNDDHFVDPPVEEIAEMIEDQDLEISDTPDMTDKTALAWAVLNATPKQVALLEKLLG